MGIISYHLDRFQWVEICWAAFVDVENFLGIPDHSGQVTGQHNLPIKIILNNRVITAEQRPKLTIFGK